ncbi:calcium-binding protein [Stenotrophomonas ginsengisoli]|uniref:calcium-binding protein n=1 Tax=Stenotrophomonas ginsengisoli TaxID=336566 RepID=UPI000A6FC028|nr:calcium-binding protein [Stenotrophomonas ginsengisoli]
MARSAMLLLVLWMLMVPPQMAGAAAPGLLQGQQDPAIVQATAQIIEHARGHRLVVLGELHGTAEIPALAARLAATYADAGPLTLALEVPHTEQAALDRYLASDGGQAAWNALAGTPFWQVSDDQHDGRRSVQMRQLVEAMRALRKQGAAVQVLAYDVAKEQADAHDHHWRDARMADNLRAAAAQQPGVLLVLSGNVHAMRARPSWAPAELQLAPMTSLLLDLEPFAVNLTAASGQFWGCLPDGCQALPARTQMTQPLLRVTEPERVYDLVLQLPQLSIATLYEIP